MQRKYSKWVNNTKGGHGGGRGGGILSSATLWQQIVPMAVRYTRQSRQSSKRPDCLSSSCVSVIPLVCSGEVNPSLISPHEPSSSSP